MPVRPARRRIRAVAVAVLVAVAGCTANGANGPNASTTSAGSSAGWSSSGSSSGSSSAESSSGSSSVPAPAPTAGTATASGTATPTTVRRTPTTTSATTGDGTCVAGRCYRVGTIFSLPDRVAPESSGIAASATVPGVFFVVDDGTGTDDIDAVRSDGSLLAKLTIAGMSARNAEALSAGPCGDRAGRCLYVGDIGDNDAKRKSITVYRVDEPSLSPAPAELAGDTWRYTYPDGPHNAEAMVVTTGGSLLILTKSAPDATTGQVPVHRIYRASAGGGMLTFVSTYRPPNPATAAQSLFTGTVVTDASYTPGRMLLLTYDEVVEYRAPTPGADPATFPTWPHAELPAPAMIQSEGITADLTGCGYEVTSEEGPGGSRAGLAGVACQ